MPKNIVFATPETIIQPKSKSLIVEAPLKEQDHVLGGPIGGPEFSIQQPDGHWAPYSPEPELQRNDLGDLFMCVSFSKLNACEFIIKKLYGDIVNFSDLYLGVGSGTIPGRGNGKRTVAEWMRLHGAVLEGELAFTEKMTQKEAYKPLTSELLAKGKKMLDVYQFPYKWLADNAPKTILDGLKYSPVQVDVLASYPTNKDGYVVWDKNNPTYAHEVIIFDYELNKCWYVFDSESQQFLKFAWSYPMGMPMIHAVNRNMRIQLLKKKGQWRSVSSIFPNPL